MLGQILKSIQFMLGLYGRHKVTTGDTAVGTIYGVKPIGGDLVYGDGCVAVKGDAPVEDETVPEGDIDLWPASTVVVKTGDGYVYGTGIVVTS